MPKHLFTVACDKRRRLPHGRIPVALPSGMRAGSIGTSILVVTERANAFISRDERIEARRRIGAWIATFPIQEVNSVEKTNRDAGETPASGEVPAGGQGDGDQPLTPAQGDRGGRGRADGSANQRDSAEAGSAGAEGSSDAHACAASTGDASAGAGEQPSASEGTGDQLDRNGSGQGEVGGPAALQPRDVGARGPTEESHNHGRGVGYAAIMVANRGRATGSHALRGPARAGGGVFATLKSVRPNRAQIARARRVFGQLVGASSLDEGPRWNGAKVAGKLAGYLRPFTVSDRRIEAGRPALMILADVSGSIGPFAGAFAQLAAVTAAIGTPGADVIAVVTTNGVPVEVSVNGAPAETVTLNGVGAWYREIATRYAVEAVVALGDGDGASIYAEIMASMPAARLYWLDCYRCTLHAPRIASVTAHHPELGESAARTRYAYAVGDTDAALDVLSRLVRMV